MTCEREEMIIRQLALDSKVVLASDLNGSSSALWFVDLGKPFFHIVHLASLSIRWVYYGEPHWVMVRAIGHEQTLHRVPGLSRISKGISFSGKGSLV